MNKEVKISAVVIKRGSKYSAQCLEYNIATQGSSIPESIMGLFRSLIGQAYAMIETGLKPLEDLPEAPSYYQELFEEGELLVRDDLSLRYAGEVSSSMKDICGIKPSVQEIRLVLPEAA